MNKQEINDLFDEVAKILGRTPPSNPFEVIRDLVAIIHALEPNQDD